MCRLTILRNHMYNKFLRFKKGGMPAFLVARNKKVKDGVVD